MVLLAAGSSRMAMVVAATMSSHGIASELDLFDQVGYHTAAPQKYELSMAISNSIRDEREDGYLFAPRAPPPLHRWCGGIPLYHDNAAARVGTYRTGRAGV